MLGSYIARLASTYLRSARGPRVGFLDEVKIPLRIWPTDVDVYLHVNNGRYLTLMDFGRLVHGLRTGAAEEVLKRRWVPVVGAATVTFRKELKTFDRCDLVSRFAWWDERWFYYVQRLEKGGVVHAEGAVRALMKHKGRTVNPGDLAEVMGVSREPPAIDDSLKRWIASLS